MKHLASIINHFWKRWRSEYLNELRESHRYMAKKTSHPSHVTKGDVVIVHNEALPRGLWKLGRIQELFVGRDNLPRSALVRVATRDRQHTLLKRPLQLLYPLEIHEPEPPEAPSENVSTFSQTFDAPVPERRPIRAAARRANERRRIWIQELQDPD